MSTLNQLNAIDSTLFTNLSAEQSEMVAGGATLRIRGIECAKAGADWSGPDDTYIQINSQTVWGPREMKSRSYVPLNLAVDFSIQSSVNVYDSDYGYDDSCGSFFVSEALTDGIQYKDISGSGSRYRVFYEVTAA
jgi:hypothetical protein